MSISLISKSIAVVAGGLYIGVALADWYHSSDKLVEPIAPIEMRYPVERSTLEPVVLPQKKMIKSKKKKRRAKRARFKSWGWRPR